MKKLSSTLSGILFVTAFAAYLVAQQPEQFPAAPVPPAIANAKTVFISNGGQEGSFQMVHDSWYSGGPNRPYNQFYAAMNSWGKLGLMVAPAQADLVLEISFDGRIVNVSQFKLVILDPKTNIKLWTLTKNVEYAGMAKNREKNYNLAMESLINDLKDVVSSPSGTAQR